jgi:hypothetical protein
MAVGHGQHDLELHLRRLAWKIVRVPGLRFPYISEMDEGIRFLSSSEKVLFSFVVVVAG